jgi:alginate O-acetyltransferase complex protein AlgI
LVFSSPIFLFGFLPLALIFYFLSPKAAKNLVLLVISLVFYAWGEIFYVCIMLFSILANYVFGVFIQAFSGRPTKSKYLLISGVIVNLLLLISFKYANFISDNLDVVLEAAGVSTINLAPVHLPLGISFFTFQAMSYIIDVYRRKVPAQKNLFNLALYISLFPQLIAGPIVRYKDIADQILQRTHPINLFAKGIRRFIYGLAKKTLIANTLGQVADNIFGLTGNDLTTPLAWLGIVAYSLQIYFDFSGYSDMAIGLGMMFGFKFFENFNYPYISNSVQEFWRRWHISLSTWFRDYVYISLGGNRVSTFRVYVNLLTVFMLTGFWHGASWSFLVFGLFHGGFLVIERLGLGQILKNLWRPASHMYLILVVMIGFVIFRAGDLEQAIFYLKSMSNLSNVHTTEFQYAQALSYEAMYAFAFGILLSMPIFPRLTGYLISVTKGSLLKRTIYIDFPETVLLSILFLLSIMKIASSTYNPFIYFRF